MSDAFGFEELWKNAYGSPSVLTNKFGGLETVGDFLRALEEKYDADTCMGILRAIVEVADFAWVFKSNLDKNACAQTLSGAQCRLGGCIVAVRLASANGVRQDAPFTIMQIDENRQYSCRRVLFDAKTSKFSVDSHRTHGLSHESLGVAVDLYVRRVENGRFYSLPEKLGGTEYASYGEDD